VPSKIDTVIPPSAHSHGVINNGADNTPPRWRAPSPTI